MPPETRRAAREAAAHEPAPDTAEKKTGRGRRARRIVLWTIVGLLVVVLAAAVWLATRALIVKDELEAAQKVVSTITADDDESADTPLADRLAEIGVHSEKAAAAANDPLWRALEWVPVAGENLRAVRLASDSLDVLANDIGTPAMTIMSGGSDAPLASVLDVLQTQEPRVAQLAAEVADVSGSTALVGPVRSGIDQVDEVLQAAVPLLTSVPALLGADGVRNYLLVFQNNAEALPLGGSAASQTLVTADNGQIAIAKQASSATFVEGVPVDVAVDDSAMALYGVYLVDHVNTSVSRPDFPTAAQILKAFWQRDISPDPIDAVVSIDPLALARVLKATGPITVGDAELNSSNAVSVLLSDVYQWFDATTPDGAIASDEYFASVASQVFAKVSGGAFDLKDMLWAINESIDNGDIMLWSEDEELSSMISGHRIEGKLPTDNDAATTVGVFFRDTSASKIDFYMDTATNVSETCNADVHSFATSTSLHLDLTQAEANALPKYVAWGRWKAQQYRTEVFIYGPPGTTVESTSVDGRDLRPYSTTIDDLGRPVAAFEVYLRPTESATVDATFVGAGSFGPLDVRTTPMVRATEVQTSSSCG